MTPRVSYRASWILPITSPPIPDGWVVVEGGRIAAVGAGAAPAGPREVNLGSRVILPGLVNAHTHLELSWMRARVPPASRMADWIRALMVLRREVHRDDPLAMAAAVGEARRAGTSLVGDISNTLASIHALGASPLGGCLFYELLGFNHPDPAGLVREKVDQVRAAARPRVRTSLVPHAPYSVAPAMLRAIAALASEERWYTSIHLGESADELEFLATGRGAFRDLLESVGAWSDTWQPPGAGPLAYIESCGLLNERTLIVHAVHLTDEELRRVAQAGATIVTCPRSNRWVGVGDPPIARFYGSGARVAIGTDSLASCPDLNLFAELARLREISPQIPAGTLLHSATQAGAEALGFAQEHGALEPGRRADLFAVEIPAGTADVEEYLCSGIRPDAISWLEARG
ncbi:MAG: amidohydrolase family protein [Acidobacteriota bacterium]